MKKKPTGLAKKEIFGKSFVLGDDETDPMA
jgi:hypothetical protein